MNILKRMWIWLVIAIVYALLIHLLFSINVPFDCMVTHWDASDMLGYGGSIIGASATIYAVVATIIFERKQQERIAKMSAKPWICSNVKLINSYDEIDKIDDSLFTCFDDNKLYSTYHISPSPFKNKKDNECFIQYIYFNCGGNTATNMKITINDKSVRPEFALPLSLKKNLIVKLPLPDNQDEMEYTIKFEYGDIATNTIYSQIETITIEKDEIYGVALVQKADKLLSSPKEVV